MKEESESLLLCSLVEGEIVAAAGCEWMRLDAPGSGSLPFQAYAKRIYSLLDDFWCSDGKVVLDSSRPGHIKNIKMCRIHHKKSPDIPGHLL